MKMFWSALTSAGAYALMATLAIAATPAQSDAVTVVVAGARCRPMTLGGYFSNLGRASHYTYSNSSGSGNGVLCYADADSNQVNGANFDSVTIHVKDGDTSGAAWVWACLGDDSGWVCDPTFATTSNADFGSFQLTDTYTGSVGVVDSVPFAEINIPRTSYLYSVRFDG